MPVSLFSSGPLGSEDPQPKGEPTHIDQLISRTRARGHRTFVGQLDKNERGLGERLIVRAVGAPDGDFGEAFASYVTNRRGFEMPLHSRSRTTKGHQRTRL